MSIADDVETIRSMQAELARLRAHLKQVTTGFVILTCCCAGLLLALLMAALAQEPPA